RAAAPCVPRRAVRRGELPAVLRASLRRRAPRSARRRPRRSDGARRPGWPAPARRGRLRWASIRSFWSSAAGAAWSSAVGVSTGGTSPALARAMREELERFLTAEYAILAQIAAEARRELRAAGRVADAETWRRALGPEVRRLIVERGPEEAKRHLLERLG